MIIVSEAKGPAVSTNFMFISARGTQPGGNSGGDWEVGSLIITIFHYLLAPFIRFWGHTVRRLIFTQPLRGKSSKWSLDGLEDALHERTAPHLFRQWADESTPGG